MKLLIDIGHPAHAHLFRNFIKKMEEKSHKILVTARDKEVSFQLLNHYRIPFISRGKGAIGALRKAINLLKTDYKLYRIARKFQPDLLIGGVANMYIAQVSKLIGKPSIIFDDTAYVKLQLLLMKPFASTICTPASYGKPLGKKHVMYDGYGELAYLHPNVFKPDPSVLDDLNVRQDERFSIIRFVAWKAIHDSGHDGFGIGMKKELIKNLNRYGKVFISSESELPKELEKYRIRFSPEKMHSALYYANLVIGDGATMSTEAGLLGTPSVRSSSLLGLELDSNFSELMKKYGLVYSYPNADDALEKAIEIMGNPNSKKEWQKKREIMLKDKIDVTKWMVDFVENYPKSFYEYQKKH